MYNDLFFFLFMVSLGSRLYIYAQYQFHGFCLRYLMFDAPLLPVQEACSLLPKISSKETHPKIAQVLLERHKPDMALLVLKCTGRDSFSATENFEKDGVSSLSEAVTARSVLELNVPS